MRGHIAIRETCVAGRTIERIIKMPNGNHKGRRSGVKAPSTEEIKKYNDIVAERNFRRLVNHNFGYGDGHFTLTYAEVVSPEDAQRDMENFIKRLRRRMAKEGKDLKYVSVTEYENKRIHHHMIINTNDSAMIDETWQKGHVWSSLLDRSGDYSDLANYLIKETQKTFRKEEHYKKRRYAASRNLVRPIVKREEVSVRDIFEDPKPTKGYTILKDSISRYEHPITGCTHLEYREIAQSLPRFRRWGRGKPIRQEMPYRFEEEKQISLFPTDDESDYCYAAMKG